MLNVKSILTLLAAALFPLITHAVTFHNGYIAFEMPDDWKCSLEQTEWVCRSENPAEAKEAVIILTAKEKGLTDSIPLYEQHMNSPIQTQTRAGETLTSTVKYKAQSSRINNHLWLDGLHLDSEVKHYFTRYMATVKGGIAILVTFSAHNKVYAKYSASFNKAIQTLQINDLTRFPLLVGGDPQENEFWHLAGSDGREVASAEEVLFKRSALGTKLALGVVVLVVAALIFLVFRIYRRKKRTL